MRVSVLHGVAAVGFGMLFLISACAEKAPPPEERPRPVRFVEVSGGTGTTTETFSGTAKAQFEKTLSFKVAGTVTARPVRVGDLVGHGDLLAELDDQDFRVAVREAEAGVSSAKAQKRNAEAEFDRTVALYEKQNASKSDLDAARSASESSDAQVAAAAERLKAAKLTLSYARLVAPQDCSIAETQVEENENVSACQPVLAVNCGECAEIVVNVPENVINRVTKGDAVKVQASTLAGKDFPGKVKEVGVATGDLGATFQVTVALTESCPPLRSGMAADVVFTFQNRETAGQIVVPLLSVGEDRDGRFVFVLEPGEGDLFVAKRRSVTLGQGGSDGLIILEGLKSGEKVATAGVRRLQEGQEVTLLETGAGN